MQIYNFLQKLFLLWLIRKQQAGFILPASISERTMAFSFQGTRHFVPRDLSRKTGRDGHRLLAPERCLPRSLRPGDFSFSVERR